MAVRGVINEFFNVEDFQKQLSAVTDGINKYIDLVKGAPSIRAGMSDTSKIKETVEGMKQLSEQNKAVSDSAAKVADEQKKLADSLASLPKTLQDNISKQIEYKGRLTELGSSLKDLKKQQDILDKTSGNDAAKKEIKDRVQLYSEEQAKLKVLNTDLTRTINAQVKEGESAANSIDNAKAAVARLTAERNKINVTTDEGRAKVDALNKAIDAQNDFLKVNASQLEKVKINIGNYEGSAAIIVEALKDVEKEISNLQAKQQGLVNLSKSNPIGFKLSGGADELNRVNAQIGFTIKQAETLGAITSNPKFLNIAAQAGDTNKELKFFTQRLNELEDAGLKNSKVYSDVQSRLAQLADQMGDTRAEIKALSSDTRGFDLFAGSVNFAADAFQAFAGAAALAGESEEESAKTIKTLVAIQSVSNGVKGIANELTTKGTAANKAYALVQKQVAILTAASTSATQKLNAVLKLSGIGLLITGIAFLISKLSLFSDESEKAEEETKRLTEAIEAQRKAVDNLNASLDASSKLRIEKIKQDGILRKQAEADVNKQINEEELRNKEQQLANLEVQEERSFAARVSNELQFQRDIQAAIKASGGKVDESDITDKGRKDLDDRRKALREQNEQDQQRLLAAQRDIAQIRAQGVTKELEDQKNISEKEKKEAEERAKKAKELADQRLKTEFEIGKITIQQNADFNKEIADDDTRTSADRLFALQQYLLSRSSIINENARVEKELGKKTAQEILLINEQAADELLRLQREVSAQGSEILKNNTKDGAKIRDDEKSHLDDLGAKVLAGFKDRSDKELAIAKDLLEKKKVLREEEKELYKSLFTELEGFAIEIFTSQQDREIHRNEDEKARIDERRQKEIETINQTVTDKAVAADQIRIIDAKANADKLILNNKNKELERKKQSIERLGKIAEITGNTAQGVASLSVKAAEARAQAALLASNPLTAAFGPIALANSLIIAAQIPLVIGIGAAQIARLVIPKYAQGTENHPGGLAVVGDGGKSEGIKTPDGKLYKTDSKSTLVNLPKGSQVYPDINQLALTQSLKEIPDVKVIVPFDKTGKAIEKMERSIVKTIKDKQENHWHFPSRYETAMRDGSRFRAYLNDNL